MKTAQALRDYELATGKPWRESITTFAEQGYSWSDVADILGIKTTALKQWCHSRNLSFPWQGVRSPIMRQHQSRTLKGRKVGTQSHYPTYTAFGVTASLPKLAEQFGHLHNVTYETLRRRVKDQGLTPEQALSLPPMSRSERAQYANDCRYRPDNHNHPWGTYYGEYTPPHAGL